MSDDIYNQQSNFVQILKGLINSLPSTYNKETNDTNYYRILRSLALELSNAEIEVQRLKDDKYLDTVSRESIYNNFGTLVRLNKDGTWDDEKYRRLVQGVMQSLLAGPTKQSLVDGLKLFTNFNINVYELYKDASKLDHYIFDGLDVQFAFVLEIEKPLENFADQTALMKDAQYLVNIIKPAHTISLIITTLFSDVNYKTWYSSRYQKNYYETTAKQFIKNYTDTYINEIKKTDVNAVLPQLLDSPSVVDYHDYIDALDVNYKSIRDGSSLGTITLPSVDKLRALTRLENYAANSEYVEPDTKEKINIKGYYDLLNSSEYLTQQVANDFDIDFEDIGSLYSEYMKAVRYEYSKLTSVPSSLPTLPTEFDFSTVTEYYGMDEIDFVNIPEGTPDDDPLYDHKNHGKLRYKDNIFPYRYKGPGVFTTNQSKIGGIDNIAPQYMVKDNEFVDFEFFGDELTLPIAEEMADTEVERDDSYDVTAIVQQYYETYIEFDIDAPKANDDNNFIIDSSANFEDYYDFVGGGGSTFQLFRNNMGSKISGTSKLGSYYADLNVEVGYDFADQYYVTTLAIDDGTIDIDQINEMYDVVTNVTTEQGFEVEDYELYDTLAKTIDRGEEVGYEYTDIFNTQDSLLGAVTEITSESSETVTAAIEYFESLYVDVTEIFDTPDEWSSMDYIAETSEDTFDYTFSEDLNEEVGYDYTDDHIVTTAIIDDTESMHIEPIGETYNVTYALDSYSNNVTLLNEDTAPFLTDIQEKYSYIAETNYSEDNQTITKVIDAPLSQPDIPHSDNITTLHDEQIPRLTLGKTPLNSSRLGGLVRDQWTMVAG